MSCSAVASDYAKLADVTKKLSETEKRIQGLYAEWEKAPDELK